MLTVLVVDDEPGFQHILSVILQRAGYQVLYADNAFEAIKSMEVQLPDLIILDDMMPGMSGGDLCIRLKHDSRYSHIPVIMHTANSRFNNPALIESVGADGVLLKPCISHDILSIVERFAPAKI